MGSNRAQDKSRSTLSPTKDAGENAIHCKFDVWVTQNDDLLVSDLGLPSEEPKQNLAFGLTLESAFGIAEAKARQLGTKIVTTQRKCAQCGKLFWMSDHLEKTKVIPVGRGHICPHCLGSEAHRSLVKETGSSRQWCG